MILTEEQGQYPFGLHLEILEDPDGQLTVEQFDSPEYNQAEETLYLRFRNDASMTLPLTLWSAEAFAGASQSCSATTSCEDFCLCGTISMLHRLESD